MEQQTGIGVPAAPTAINLQQLLKAMVEKGASDLHITTGTAPQLRIDGALVPLRVNVLTPAETKQICYSVLTDQQKMRFEEDQELDFSFGVRNLGAKDEEIETATCFKGVGCNICGGSGYKGRIAVYEVMPMMEQVKELVLQGASAVEIKAEAIRGGMRTLRMSGISKVCGGVTTFDEVARITAAD